MAGEGEERGGVGGGERQQCPFHTDTQRGRDLKESQEGAIKDTELRVVLLGHSESLL